MTDQRALAEIARGIIDGNLYMVLGTADEAGHPWVSPVYYAPATYGEFIWVSSPDARHSRNLEARHEVSIVIFDSSAPIGTGQAVYMSAVAQELADNKCTEAVATFSSQSIAHGGHEWTLEDVQQPARHRLYGATAVDHYVLGPHDHRVTVTF